MKLLKYAGRVGMALALVTIAGCASAPPDADVASIDRTEGVNRAFHEFNVGLDTAVVRPLARTYQVVTPEVVKLLVTNGFSYLSLPGDFANHVLQGNIQRALVTLGRFTLNTVMGGGLLDPATEFGLPKQDTDFGVTLAKYGAGEGNFFVFPIFGPATTRDAVGRLVDNAFAPTNWLGLSWLQSGGVYTARTVEFRERNMTPIDEVLYNSEDSYVSLRSIYIQHRRALVAGDSAPAGEALPDIFSQ